MSRSSACRYGKISDLRRGRSFAWWNNPYYLWEKGSYKFNTVSPGNKREYKKRMRKWRRGQDRAAITQWESASVPC